MDKNAIKSFAIESRRQMIESVKYQASLIGITSDNISEPISKAEGMETYDYGAGTYTLFDEDIHKRENLVKEIKNKGFENVVEEVAYTWFNRIIAIRFMEVNDYLPTRTRVLSSETQGKLEPDIITEALDLDLNYSQEDMNLILKLKEENKLDELFQFLFIKQCNKLNEILPGLFENTDDYLELLLNISFTNDDGIIRQLINTIHEDDFGIQVEIIGWLYQFYNSELKDETFDNLKRRKIKISKEKIPAATQLFTPDWIVKYMVENSVGRIWLENNPHSKLKSKWKYFVDEPQQESEVKTKLMEIKKESEILKPEDIKIIDPCMGSGHILVYVFDVLMDIYISEGYTEKDAAESILLNNIYGLDIDKRAYQLSYFAVLMKARKYNRKLFNKNIFPNLCVIEETNNISSTLIDKLILEDKSIENDLIYLLNLFNDAKEYGSILELKKLDFLKLNDVINTAMSKLTDLDKYYYSKDLFLLNNIIKQAILLSNKYDAVITNPPYMGHKGMGSKLDKFLKGEYPNSRYDLSAVFIERCNSFSKDTGFIAMITQQSFLFLSRYENLRKNFIKSSTIIDMVHLGAHAFDEIGGEVVQTVSFVNRKTFIDNYISVFHRLIEYNSEQEKEKEFFNDFQRYEFKQTNFFSIPRSPIAYWVSNKFIDIFKNNPTLDSFSFIKQGLATGDNKKYLRYWFEVDMNNINFSAKSKEEFSASSKKFCPYKKGGSYRKWYGNQDYIIKFDDKSYNELLSQGNHLPSRNFYFLESISWSAIASASSFRYYPDGFVFDAKGSSLFFKDDFKEYNYYILGFLNSYVSEYMLDVLTPNLDYSVGYISLLPFIINENYINKINSLVLESINISEIDWNSYETSWNFIKHPFLNTTEKSLIIRFKKWQDYKSKQIELLKNNENELNNIFLKIYDLDINIKNNKEIVSISEANYIDDIKSFISYSVGCMFGRYSLDNEGIQFAGGKFDLNNYSKFTPDNDNIIPVLDTEYFEDDIVGRFVEFVKLCFGEDTLEENLDFIASALKKKGKTSREVIRNYFLSDFFKDHAKMYNKCPIYWQFGSGKQNAFNCLIYMHRYQPELVARVRTDYLHKTQKAIEQNMSHCDNIIANSSNKSEISKATKDKSKYIKQLDEIKVYDEALRHIATQNIEIDLDDGVKVNYNKFQKVELSIEGEKPKKINLLKNI